jgi:two-component system sensor histidine kinase UhpB
MTRDELVEALAALQRAVQADAPGAPPQSPAESERLLHELHVHQIELEMQNRELREAQQALEVSRDRYAQLYDFAPVGYVTLDQAQCIADINLTGAALLGVERAHLIGQPFVLYVAAADRLVFQQHLARCYRTSDLVISEIELKGRNDARVRVQLSSTCSHDGEDALQCAITLTDISARARAERALQASEARYRTVSELMSDYVFAVRVAADGRMEPEWSAGTFPAITGYTLDEIVRPGVWRRLIAPEDQMLIEGDFAALLRGETLVLEARMITTAGRRRWFQVHAHPELDPAAQRVTRIVGAMADITERKQAEAELRATTARLQTIIQAAPMAVLVLSPAGVVQLWNPAAEQLFGWQASEVLGRPTPIVPADQRDTFQALLARVCAGETIAGLTARRLQRDGTPVDVLLAAAPLHDAADAVSGALYLLLDLTELEEVRASRARLQTLSQRLLNSQEAERRRIAQTLHDEIGQALTALKFNLEIAHDDLDLARGSGALAEGIAMVAQILQQVRTLALDLRPSVLDDLGLVAALRSYLDRQAQRGGIEGTFRLEGSQAQRLESSRLPHTMEIACFRAAQEALTNVLRHAQARHVSVVLRADDDAVTLLIRDDGVGFDVAAAQGRAVAGGSMGLLGMQEQVALAAGQFAIASAPGSGTRIRIHFPLAPDGIATEVRQPADPAARATP